ncbi:hypothetical protein Rcas_0323 [Roseiflexus castenholzii DSM 13941]|uniref:Uncharacterized protein n=1 Tax=Roseiflexus castenholzii (strain DSM 13941 / HLO8) TaxID=383372 RepID=A7NG69_ROSCS|nr:hypothetical protein Rcas_0323 [Roseiflexus castenholzii DSM 13941]
MQFFFEGAQARFNFGARLRFTLRPFRLPLRPFLGFVARPRFRCARFRLPLRLFRLPLRSCCCLRRLPHDGRVATERYAAFVVADNVIPLDTQPQVGDHQMHPPCCVRRVQPVRIPLQPIVKQAQTSLTTAATHIVHNHVLRHPRARVVLHLALQVVLARLRRGDLDDQRRTRAFDRHLECAPVLPFADAGNDHHIRSVRTQVGDVPGNAHIAQDDGDPRLLQTGAQHGGEVHPVGRVAAAVHNEISRFRVQDVLERQRNLFQVMGIIGSWARHEAPAIAEGIVGGRRIRRLGGDGRLGQRGSSLARPVIRTGVAVRQFCTASLYHIRTRVRCEKEAQHPAVQEASSSTAVKALKRKAGNFLHPFLSDISSRIILSEMRVFVHIV